MRIGIIGGGQLAAMLVEADPGNLHNFYVLDPDPDCPAVRVGASHVAGNPASGEGLQDLADQVDILTTEIENVCVGGVSKLVEAGAKILPSVALLAKVTNKLEQKKWLQALDLPTAPFVSHDGQHPIDPAPFGFPIVQKAARGGYDGRGVAVLRMPEDNKKRLKVAGFVEQYIKHQMELSVIVVASEQGDIRAYDPVEMMFRSSGNVLDYLIAPARIDAALQESARQLAVRTIKAMSGVGVFGVEMFMTPDNDLLINEISPRTHNSGHYTREACNASQFDQQLRILTGQPLAEMQQHSPAVMFNLLGESGFSGTPVLEDGCSDAEKQRVYVHMYGKQHCFPGRKMGHVTVLGDSVDAALNRAIAIKSKIIVKGASPIEN